MSQFNWMLTMSNRYTILMHYEAYLWFLKSWNWLIFNISISDIETKPNETRLYGNQVRQDDDISQSTFDTPSTNRSRKMPRKGNKRVNIINYIKYFEIKIDKLEMMKMKLSISILLLASRTASNWTWASRKIEKF